MKENSIFDLAAGGSQSHSSESPLKGGLSEEIVPKESLSRKPSPHTLPSSHRNSLVPKMEKAVSRAHEEKREEEEEELISMIKQAKEVLQTRFFELAKKVGMSPEGLREHLKQKSNFTSAQWEEAQQFTKVMRELLHEEGLSLDTPLLDKKGESGRRKGRTLGVRKGWTPVQ